MGIRSLGLIEETQDDLRRLLKRLDSDPAVAWGLYLTLWQKLVMFFERHGCQPATDNADQVLSRIARRNDLDAIKNVGAFAYGVARKIKMERLAERNKVVEFDDSTTPVISNADPETEVIDGIDKDRKVQCIVKCLRKLPPEERRTFISFELADPETRVADRARLAQRLRVSAGTLRVSVFRTRQQLAQNVRKCLRMNG